MALAKTPRASTSEGRAKHRRVIIHRLYLGAVIPSPEFK